MMDALMSNIFAMAIGKDLPSLSSLPESEFSTDSFVTAEDFRRDISMQVHDSSADSSSSFLNTSSYSDSSTDCEDEANTSTYMSYDNLSPPASPTYVRGDFYHLTPPSSPSLGAPCEHTPRSPRCSPHSFSIDRILGNTTEDNGEAERFPETKEKSPVVGFTLGDWDFFQRHRSSRQICSASSRSAVRSMFWCHSCEDICVDSADADAHQHFHSSNNHTCKLQRELFSQTGYVSVHSGTNHYNKVMCGLCRQIVYKHFFGRHISSHDSHVCIVCSLEFPSATRLHDHTSGHTIFKNPSVHDTAISTRQQTRRPRPATHQCEYCNKSFRTKYACAVHQGVHTGRKPYTCQVPGCKKAFAQTVQLRLHARLHC